jgi:hypothetical protein
MIILNTNNCLFRLIFIKDLESNYIQCHKNTFLIKLCFNCFKFWVMPICRQSAYMPTLGIVGSNFFGPGPDRLNFFGPGSGRVNFFGPRPGPG